MNPSTTSALAAPLLETKVPTAVPNTVGSGNGSDADSDDGTTPFPPYVERDESLYDTSSIDDNESFQTTSGGPALADSLDGHDSASPSSPSSSSPPPLPEPAGEAPPEQISREPERREPAEAPETAPPPPPPPSSTLSPSSPPDPESQPPPYWMHTRPTAPSPDMASSTASTALPPPLPPRHTGPPLPPRPATGGVRSPFRLPWPTFPFTTNSSTPKADPGHGATAAAEASAAWSHYRDNSASSASSVDLITLQDNEAQEEAEAAARYGSHALYGYHGGGGPGSAALSGLTTATSRCWARRVDLTDFVVVGGRGAAATTKGAAAAAAAAHSLGGSFVVWTVRVQTLQGGAPLLVHKRYSEFDTLRRRLVASFPTACAAAVPPLPPKTVLHNFQPTFLEQRRLGLQYFLNCILLNPEFSGSPVLKEFLFS